MFTQQMQQGKGRKVEVIDRAARLANADRRSRIERVRMREQEHSDFDESDFNDDLYHPEGE